MADVSGKNFVSLLLNTKTRTLVVVVGFILVGGLVLALMSGSKTSSKDQIPESRTVAVPTDVRSTPGANISQSHRELLEEANKAGSAKADKTGKTFIPTITGNANYFQDNNIQSEVADGFNVNPKCTAAEVSKLRQAGEDTLTIIKELKSDGCTSDEIARLFSAKDIAAALLADTCLSAKDCDVDAVKRMRDNNKLSINEITAKMLAGGCEPSAIAKAEKAAGYSLNDIAKSMRAAKLDASTVAKALMDAGFSKAEIIPALSNAGYSPLEIANASTVMDKLAPDADNDRKMRDDDLARREAALREAQQLAVYGQQRKDVITQMVSAMDSQANDDVSTWNKLPVQNFVKGEWSDVNGKMQSSDYIDQSRASGRSTPEAKVLLKAGSILFAVLETAVNSDEPGPILATIVSDALKGSKLIGSMKANYDAGQITLSFDTISMPGAPSSMRISAVAIDPDTARTALASDVDNHYIWRWGSFLAASFVTGYASALASAGTTTTTSINPLGGSTTTSSAPSNVSSSAAVYQGLATTGSKFGDVASRQFDMKPTITIDQGTSLGIFLTADLKEDFGANVGTPLETTSNPSKSPIAAQATNAAVNASNPSNPSNPSNVNLTPAQAALLINALTNANKPVDNTTTNSGDKANG
jgi:type IV secretory pathway VirB10-like protein